MKKSAILIGLDLGTASVGWSILEAQTNQIIDMGVRLFSDRSGNNLNQERRNARHRRRQIRRKQQLRSDFVNLLIKHQLIDDQYQFQTIIKQKHNQPISSLKLMGLKSALNQNQLIAILYHYLKHRGSFNQTNLDVKIKASEQKQKDLADQLYDQNKLPSENQAFVKENDGRVKGHSINYAITNQMWLTEIKQLLAVQKLNPEFINDFINLFQRHRQYWQGPGSQQAPSPYGRWEYVDGQPTHFLGGNLWDVKIGKCTYFPDQDRHLKAAPISELFNFFNEISIYQFIDQSGNKCHLNAHQKQTILNEQLFSIAKITKYFKLQVDQEAPKLKNELKTTKQLLKIWKRLGIDFNNTWDDYLQLDLIYLQISTKSELNERIKVWQEYIKEPIVDNDLITLLSQPVWKNGTSSLSKYAMKKYLQFCLADDQGVEQMTYFNNHCQLNLENLKTNSPYLSSNYFDNQFLPLNISRPFKQAIGIINAIIKKYHKNYEIKKVVVELARELNSESVKKAIEKNNRLQNKKIEALIKKHNVDKMLNKSDLNYKEKTKLILWSQQNGIDLYDGKAIVIDDIFNDHLYEIDHIIPYSQSFDNSIMNKVLTKRIHNQNKANRSPYQWLNGSDFQKLKVRLETMSVNQDLTRMWAQKIKHYFLNQTGFDEQFLASQLNDSRYFSKVLFNYLQKFFKHNLYWNKTNKPKVVVANLKGSITNYVRYQVLSSFNLQQPLRKDRNIYSHHAIDASILTWVANDGKFMQLCNRLVKNRQINQDGVINYPPSTWFNQNKDLIKGFRSQLDQWLDINDLQKQIKFSRPMETKTNFQFANETLYGLKSIDHEYYKITKIDLLKTNPSDLEKYFDPNHKSTLFNYVETFKDERIKNELLKIYQTYRYTEYQGENSKVDNPFVKYYQSNQIQDFLQSANLDLRYNQDKIPLLWATKNQKPFWIRFIKVREKTPKNLHSVLLNHKQNNRSCYESLNANKYRIYKNQDGNYVVVGMTILNQDVINNQVVVNESKLKPMLDRLNIIDQSNYNEFTKGSMLVNEYGDLFYVSGGSQAKNNLAIKALAMDNFYVRTHTRWKDAPKQGKKENGKISGQQWQMNGNKIVNIFSRCQVDWLGNISNTKSLKWN